LRLQNTLFLFGSVYTHTNRNRPQPKFDEVYEKFRKLNEKYQFQPTPSKDIMMKVLKKKIKEEEEKIALKQEIIKELGFKETEIQEQDKRPFCIVEGKWGFLKFSKQGQKIKIGGANSQSFKLLKCITEPFGIAKSIEVVFEAVRENMKYKSKRGVYTNDIDRAQKIKIIGFAIKELQKGNKLRGKLAFRWDELKIKVWLEYLG